MSFSPSQSCLVGKVRFLGFWVRVLMPIKGMGFMDAEIALAWEEWQKMAKVVLVSSVNFATNLYGDTNRCEGSKPSIPIAKEDDN